jgi:hypothetical protein
MVVEIDFAVKIMGFPGIRVGAKPISLNALEGFVIHNMKALYGYKPETEGNLG